MRAKMGVEKFARLCYTKIYKRRFRIHSRVADRPIRMRRGGLGLMEHGKTAEVRRQMDLSYVRRNAERICAEVAELAHAYGREPPRIVAVTKGGSDAEVRALLETGLISEIGENRVDRYLARRALASEMGLHPVCHLIGTLQTNKVRYIIGETELIQSLDSLHLAETLQGRAERAGIDAVHCLIEINSGREPAKGGILPEDALDFTEALRRYPRVRAMGVMTMGPVGATAEETARCFAETRALTATLASAERIAPRPILSMGMSTSYKIAIAEGANMVRIGRALWEHESNA